MAYREIVKTLQFPQGATERFKRLDALQRVVNGTLYDDIKKPFEEEYENGGDYVPILKRRPSVEYNAAKIIVDQTSGLLWGDEQFPMIRCSANEPTDAERHAENQIEQLINQTDLDVVMAQSYQSGNTGSVAIVVRANAKKHPRFDVIEGQYAQPVFNPEDDQDLIALINVYPSTGKELLGQNITTACQGKDVKVDESYWVRIDIEPTREVRYLPMLADHFRRFNSGEKDEDGNEIEWTVSDEYEHDFGVLPAVFITNQGLRGPNKDCPFDGPCTYGAILDNIVEMDYLLSQIGRGYRFTADPLLFTNSGEMLNRGNLKIAGDKSVKTETDASGKRVQRPGGHIEGGAGSDAKYLEITGQGLEAAGKWLDKLREWSLEMLGGMKAGAEHEKGVHSGRALEVLHQALLLLVKRQRVAYGKRGLLPLLRILLSGMENGCLVLDGVQPVSPDTHMRLVWPNWITPRGQELMQLATAFETLAGGSPQAPEQILSRKTVTRLLANEYGLPDPNAEVEEVEKDRQTRLQERVSTVKEIAKATPAKPTGKGDSK